MLIIASTNGAVGIDDAMSVLKDGGSAMDAVEIGIRLVEANPADHTVGYNGYPNILGQLELDASIMDGRTLNSGAVAIMRGFPTRFRSRGKCWIANCHMSCWRVKAPSASPARSAPINGRLCSAMK